MQHINASKCIPSPQACVTHNQCNPRGEGPFKNKVYPALRAREIKNAKHIQKS